MSMNADDLIAFLQTHFPDAFIQAANQGNKFDVRVVDASFEGKRAVQRAGRGRARSPETRGAVARRLCRVFARQSGVPPRRHAVRAARDA